MEPSRREWAGDFYFSIRLAGPANCAPSSARLLPIHPGCPPLNGIATGRVNQTGVAVEAF